MMKRNGPRFWQVAVLLALQGVAAVSGEPEPPTVVTKTPEEIRKLLSKELTRDQLRQELGTPQGVSDGDRGVMLYRVPNNGVIFFDVLGPYVIRARFEKEDIKGVMPPVHSMDVWKTMRGGELEFRLDKKKVLGMEAFGKWLDALPPGAVLEWQGSCIVDTWPTEEQEREIREACKRRNIHIVKLRAG